NNVDALLGVSKNQVLGLLGSTVNNQPMITVDRLVVAGQSVVVTPSGPTAIDSQGDFTLSGTAPLGLAAYGTQPVRIFMQAHLAEGTSGMTLTFTIVVGPQSTATFQFGTVTYSGAGTSP